MSRAQIQRDQVCQQLFFQLHAVELKRRSLIWDQNLKYPKSQINLRREIQYFENQPGDVLLSVADKPVSDTVSMLNLVAQLKPGEQVKMSILR